MRLTSAITLRSASQNAPGACRSSSAAARRHSARSPGTRVMENMHSTEIGACLTFKVNAHAYFKMNADTNSRKRRRRINGGRVLVLNDPPARCQRTLPSRSTSTFTCTWCPTGAGPEPKELHSDLQSSLAFFMRGLQRRRRRTLGNLCVVVGGGDFIVRVVFVMYGVHASDQGPTLVHI